MAVIDHLFRLYFSLVHPVHTLFSEGHFVDSFKSQSDDYCSTVLVESICAMACHLATNSDFGDIDFDQLGARFSDAARTRINPEDRRLTTIQGFAVLFLVDCARGRGLSGFSYLQIASNSLLHVAFSRDEAFLEVLMNTNRGIRSLCVYVYAPLVFLNPMLTWAVSGHRRLSKSRHPSFLLHMKGLERVRRRWTKAHGTSTDTWMTGAQHGLAY